MSTTQPGPATPVEALEQQNAELRQQLKEFEDLKEQLMAQRVFEAARKRLIAYMTAGGLVLLVAGGWGIKQLVDSAKQLAAKKFDDMTVAEVKAALQREGERQISVMVAQVQDTLHAYVRQQIGLIQVANQPIGGDHAATAPAAEPGPAQPAPVAAAATAPPALDYTRDMPAVRDQGSEGAVVGFALAAAMSYQVLRATGQHVLLSPRFLYNEARREKGTLNYDSGTQIADGIRVLKQIGAVAEADWPYRPGDFAASPPDRVATARHYRIRSAQQVRAVNEIKAALRTTGPVVIGLPIYPSFQTPSRGVIPMPKPNESALGGLALCIIGYDDRQHRFKFQNSWGAGWGDNGYGYLPYDYVTQQATDGWAISGVQ